MSFSRLFRKKNMEQNPPVPEPVQLGYRLASMQGMGQRERQEDAFGWVNKGDVINIQKEGLFAIVADGMGGLQNGQAASMEAVSCLTGDFPTLCRETDIPEQLCMMLKKANNAVRQKANGRGGTTLIACLIYNQHLYYVSVGDSYLFLKHRDQLIKINREHNIRSQIFMDSVKDHTMNPFCTDNKSELAAVTSFLGLKALKEIDFFRNPYPLEVGDVLLICSDGVGGVLDERSLLQCLSQPTAQQMCHAMEDQILGMALPYQDNYTALVIQCDM